MLSDVLKQLREQRNLSQAKLAEQLKIPKGTYVTYEYGTREPNIEMINKLADFYNVTTDYLLGRDTGEPEPMEQLAGQFNMSALEQKILDNYLSLPDDMRCDFMEFLRQSVREVEEETKSGE